VPVEPLVPNATPVQNLISITWEQDDVMIDRTSATSNVSLTTVDESTVLMSSAVISIMSTLATLLVTTVVFHLVSTLASLPSVSSQRSVL